MESSQHTYTALDELRRIEYEARHSTSLDNLRVYFERVQLLRRANPDHFDLQLFIAEVQEHIIQRARMLREEPALLRENGGNKRQSGDTEFGGAEEVATAEPPPGVERLDAKNWQRAIYIGLFFAIILFAAFFYLIQTARRLNLTPAPEAAQTSGIATPVNAPAQNPANTANTPPPVSNKPTVRLYTDLVPGTVAIDGKEPEDLKDGELQLDNLEPGRHSIKVVGRTGEAAFSFDVTEKSAPKVVGAPTASNVLAVLVSTQDGKARLVTNVNQSELQLDGKSVGVVGGDGLSLDDLGTLDHDLQVTENRDRQRFVLTYTPAPALTAYIKSDPNAGTVVVVAGQDGAEIYLDNLLYKRKTERGQIRLPNLKVGQHMVRVHKNGFIDPPSQTVDVKKAEETRVEFHLLPVPEIATLQIKGALQGTMVYLDRDLAAAIGADGAATISNVKPGDHIIELRRDQALTKRFQHSFHTGEVITLSGPDVTLDKVVVESKPAAAAPPPVAAPAPIATNNSMQIEGEQVRKGGGFVPYHVPKVPGHYSFVAQVPKGGFLKKGKLQWYAGYQDSRNYVLFIVDGKHAIVREVQDGKATETNRINFSTDSNEWVQVDMTVRANALQARVKTPTTGWSDLGTVGSVGRDFTQDRVGFYIPGSDELAVSNFRFSEH